MSFGNQVVGFVTITETGPADALGMRTKTPNTVPVSGCRHRPLRADETPEWLTNTATQIWKTTAPPEAAAAAAKSTGELVVDDITYKIIGGAMPYTDLNGQVFKVTILSMSLNPAV